MTLSKFYNKQQVFGIIKQHTCEIEHKNNCGLHKNGHDNNGDHGYSDGFGESGYPGESGASGDFL